MIYALLVRINSIQQSPVYSKSMSKSVSYQYMQVITSSQATIQVYMYVQAGCEREKSSTTACIHTQRKSLAQELVYV